MHFLFELSSFFCKEIHSTPFIPCYFFQTPILIVIFGGFQIAQEAFNDLTDGIPNLEDVDLDRMLTDAMAGSPAVTGYANLRSRKVRAPPPGSIWPLALPSPY